MKTKNNILWVVTTRPTSFLNWLTTLGNTAVGKVELGSFPIVNVQEGLEKYDVVYIEGIYNINVVKALIELMADNPSKSVVVICPDRPRRCLEPHLNIINCII